MNRLERYILEKTLNYEESNMKFLLSILLLGLAFSSAAQKMLVLENSKNMKRYRYIKDSEVSFGHDTAAGEWVEGKINKVIADTIVVDGRKFALGDIYYWGFPPEKRRLANLAKIGFRYAGRIFFAVSLLNGLTNNDSPVLPKQALYALGIGEVLGLYFAKRPKSGVMLYDSKWALKLVDFSLPEE